MFALYLLERNSWKDPEQGCNIIKLQLWHDSICVDLRVDVITVPSSQSEPQVQQQELLGACGTCRCSAHGASLLGVGLLNQRLNKSSQGC